MVFATRRDVADDGSTWLELPDGWAMERTSGRPGAHAMLAPYDPLWENSSDSVPRPEGAEAGTVDRSEPRRAVSEGVTAEDLLALPTPAVSSDDLGARPTAVRNGLETRPSE